MERANATVDPMVDLQIIGGGKMGAALLGGLLRQGSDPQGILVIEPVTDRREELIDTYDVRVSAEVQPAAGSIIATKPDTVINVAAQAVESGTDRLLSVAAGVTLASIDEATGGAVPVIRAMPNTPALVGQGAAAICGNEAAASGDLQWAEGILGSVGTVVRTDEKLIDAVTGLSGSGPAYVFLVAEAMIDAGVMTGLSRPIATELAIQTLLGAATLLADGKPPAELRADVTSPGGTTAAGLRELENHGLRAAFAAAIEAASRRSQELGQN